MFLRKGQRQARGLSNTTSAFWLAMIIGWCCSHNIVLLLKKLVAASASVGGGTRGAAVAGVHQSARWLKTALVVAKLAARGFLQGLLQEEQLQVVQQQQGLVGGCSRKVQRE